MQELNHKLQHHIEIAISNYVNYKFLHSQKISERRNKDILNIRKIINFNNEDVSTKLNRLKKYLQHIQTGWGIFQTGRSKLKDFVNRSIETFKNNYIKKLITVPVNLHQQSFRVK